MMLTKGFSLLLLFLLPFSNAESQNTDGGTILGCKPSKNSPSSGFEVAYYHYPMVPSGKGCYNYDATYQTEAYQHGGYETYGGGLIGKSSGVTDLTFKSTAASNSCSKPVKARLPSNYNYNTQITVTNFSMLITGYFYAPKTGSYEFILDYIDDLTYLNVGAGRAFDCCGKTSSVSNPGPFDLSVMWPQTQNTATVYLLGGFYYPLRIFYINREGVGGLTVTFKDADGVLHKTFKNFIFSIPDGKECPVPVHTTTVPWDESYTTTFTTVSEYTNDSGKTVTENVIVVQTPEVHTATTTYTGWTGTETKTYATETITVTGEDGIPTIKTIYSVKTPEVNTATTTYTGWTGTETKTYATETITVTGEDGIPTIKTIYSVKTPEPETTAHTATTTYIKWGGKITTTYATEKVTFTGEDGKPTIETIYYVKTPVEKTPYGHTSTTAYTSWGGKITTTYATEKVTFTGEDGKPTIETIYYVKTPVEKTTYGHTSTTAYTSWTGEYSTTFATKVVTIIGGDGKPTVKTIYSVQTPESVKPSFSGWFSNTTTSHTITSSSTSSDSTTSDITSTEPIFSLTTVTTTSNGVTTVYTTTCPIDTTLTESTSCESLTSKSKTEHETTSSQISYSTNSKEEEGEEDVFNNERPTSTESNEELISSTQIVSLSQTEVTPSSDIIITSYASSATETVQEQHSFEGETQTLSSSSSTADTISVFEGSAVKLLVTPFIAVFLALL